MPPDPEQRYQALARLCRASASAGDVCIFFRSAADTLHDLAGCERVSLAVGPGAPAGVSDVTLDYSRPSGRGAVSAPEPRHPAIAEVFRHREARVVGPDHAGAGPALLFLPLVNREEIVGVLGVGSRRREEPASWERSLLEGVADLLALVLAGQAAGARSAEAQQFRRQVAYLRDEIKTDRDLRFLTGDSPAMRAVRLAIQQVAPTDSTVLVLGETGTGKELIARAIHQLSPRREQLLVAVNCAALSPGIVASELFGHEQGAFTGATRRRVGRFELAQRGTIFLDEVGELPPDTQVMLLRALQERVIERVGGQEAVPIDVRVVAATHRDLAAGMTDGLFRSDLFFRLNVFPIHVPSLRERREDIPDLVRHFLHHIGRRLNRSVTHLSPSALRLLMDYHWPGNVRELENIVERALIVAAGDTLEIDPSWLRLPLPSGGAETAGAGLAEMERRAILAALERCRGKVYGPGGAAAVLGLKPTTLYGKMRKHHIEKRPDRV